MKPMTLNIMLYDHIHKGIEKTSVNDFFDENGDAIDYTDYDDDCFSMNHGKYYLHKIMSKKFISEPPIGSGKLTAIVRWISLNKTEKFIAIVPTVNISEEFYTKLTDMNAKSIRLCVNDNAFKEFHKAVQNEVNIIITTYSTASKCLDDLLEEYYREILK